jgi:hypothetical protein
MSESSEQHEGSPHDDEASEPLGPVTPDDETPAGDTPEVHGEISPHDFPKDSPNRKPAEEAAREQGGDETTEGNA